MREAVEPTPPQRFLKMAEHHWLEVLDSDGHSFGLIVLQWAPGAKHWCYSGNVGSNLPRHTAYYRYVAHCPMPPID